MLKCQDENTEVWRVRSATYVSCMHLSQCKFSVPECYFCDRIHIGRNTCTLQGEVRVGNVEKYRELQTTAYFLRNLLLKYEHRLPFGVRSTCYLVQ
jgi:hypothetical protein